MLFLKSRFQESNQPSPDSTNVKKSKSKTPFTLIPEFEKHDVDVIDGDLDAHANDPSKNDNFYTEQNGLINKSDNKKRNEGKPTTNGNLSVISVSSETEFKEINNGNSVIYIYIFFSFFKLLIQVFMTISQNFRILLFFIDDCKL